MSSFPTPACRLRAPHSLWEPAASARQPQPLAEAPRAVRAAFPPLVARIRPVHSTLAVKTSPALHFAVVESPASAREAPGALPGAFGCVFGRLGLRLDRAEQAGEVDLKEVPGQSCLWILRYLRYVWSVFSCRFQHLCFDTGITHLHSPLQIVCTPSHTVLYREPQTSVERFLVRVPHFSSIHLVPVDNSVSIMGLVELPAGRFSAAVIRHSKLKLYP